MTTKLKLKEQIVDDFENTTKGTKIANSQINTNQATTGFESINNTMSTYQSNIKNKQTIPKIYGLQNHGLITKMDVIKILNPVSFNKISLMHINNLHMSLSIKDISLSPTTIIGSDNVHHIYLLFYVMCM